MPKAMNCNIVQQQILENNQPNISYTPWIFNVCGFPYRNPQFREKSSTLTYKMSNGDRQVLFLSSRNGLPYGVVPRRIINYLSLKIKESKSKIISLGETKTEIIKKILNKHVGGRDLQLFQEQFKRTLETNFFYAYDKPTKDSKAYFPVETISVPIGNFQAQENFWDSISGEAVLHISEPFLEIVNHSFPVNDDKLSLLKSPRHIDLYGFLHRQNHHLCVNFKEPFRYDISFLKEIFGKDLPDNKQGFANFRAKLKESLGVICELDKFRIDLDHSHLKLTPDRDLIFDPNNPKIYQIPKLQKVLDNKLSNYRIKLTEIIGVEVGKLSDSLVKQLHKTVEVHGRESALAAYQYAKERSSQKDRFESYLGMTLNNPDWYAGVLEANKNKKIIEAEKQKNHVIITNWRNVNEQQRAEIRDKIKTGLEHIIKVKIYEKFEPKLSKILNESTLCGILATYNLGSEQLSHKNFNFINARSETCYYYWLLTAFPDENHRPQLPTNDSMLGYKLAQKIITHQG